MAVVKDKFIASNPTNASITACGVAIPAGSVRKIETAGELPANSESLYKAVCAGLCVATNSLTNPSGAVTAFEKKVTTAVGLSQQGSRLLQALDRSTISVGADTHAATGQ